ncbi:MAG: hypothetical protein F6K21_27660 [Symploca sp. SIO2D2]|nr:hypothetical protein [Symploca sp. SIO2D2]
MNEKFTPPGDCPVCGAFVPRGALSCDECGSCSDTGWNEEAFYDGLDLPTEEDVNSQGSSTWVKYLICAGLALLLIYAFVLN